MGVKSKVLNIEIGDRITKVCCTVSKRKVCKIFESFMFQTPEGYVNEGVIEDTAGMADILRQQLEGHGLGNIKDVVFAISSSKVASREVNLPPMKEKLIADVVKTNAKDYFPVDLSSYQVTYSLLEKVKGSEPGLRILVMAAPISLLAGYFETARRAGLRVKAVDTSGNSHFQALKNFGDDKLTMYIGVDCTGSYVTFMEDKNLLMQRTFAYGGDEMIARYMVNTGKTADQYIEALEELTVNTPITVTVPDILSEEEIETGLGRLVSNIARSVDYFNSNRWEQGVQQIVLMGPCGKLVGLRELIVANTALPTYYLEEMPGAVAMTNSAHNASFYISCIGSSIAPVDMMPASLVAKSKPEKDSNQSLRSGVFACVGLILISALLSGWAIFRQQNELNELEKTQSRIAELQYAEDIYNTYLSYQKGQEAVETITSLAELPNSKLVSFYRELENKMPSSILLMSASCTNEGVSLNLTTASYTDAARVIEQFRSFKTISVVDVSSVSRSIDELGKEIVSFSIACQYGENPYLEGINPYGELVRPQETEAESTSEEAE